METKANSHDRPTITWNIVKVMKFDKRYMTAKQEGAETFEFDGHEFVTNYAKYLLEYLKRQFDIPETRTQ
jgi:hypothetical protein